MCGANDKQIVSRDKGNPQYHKAINTAKAYVTHYQIDGVIIKSGEKDYDRNKTFIL